MRRVFLAAVLLLASAAADAEPIRVRYWEGAIHGFLAVRTTDGKLVAMGDQLQSVRRGTVTSRLSLRFLDGSTSDETTVFTQGRVFRLVSDRLVQKGPAFKMPMEMSVDGKTGDVTVHVNEDGKEKTYTEHLALPDDLANGLLGVVMKSVAWETPKTTLSMVVAAPKPRLVKLVITPVGKEPLAIGKINRRVMHYKIVIELGGVAGVVAPLVGKAPPDAHLWILGGEVPTYLMSEAPVALGGPALHMELVGPYWPKSWAAPKVQPPVPQPTPSPAATPAATAASTLKHD
jgi:hypothetical protein